MMGTVVPEAVPPDLVEALSSVQVTVSAGQRSGFQLAFTLGKDSRINKSLIRSGFFDPPRRVVIVATLNGTPNVLMDGVITRQEVSPSNEPGQSKLTVTGEDLSRMMDLIDFSGFPFPAMPDAARVLLMVAKYGMYGIVPLVVPSVRLDFPNPLSVIPMQQGTDLQYITALAENVGYVFYIDPGPAPGTSIAYWGPEIKTGMPQAALIVDSDAHTNVDSMSFNFDGFSKTLFVLSIQNPALKVPIPVPIPDVNPLSPPLGQKLPLPLQVKPVTGTAKLSFPQTVMLGLAKAARSADVIGGSGSLDVLRYGRLLQARRLVEVRGAGNTYDGLYFVKSVTHDIKPGEYKQSFTLSRNALIP